MYISPLAFKAVYLNEYNRRVRARHFNTRSFKSNFGLTPDQCASLWNCPSAESDISHWRPKYLLDALYFMKVYTPEDVTARVCQRDPKTLRKWNKHIIETIAEVDWIDFEGRLTRDNGSTCKITLDGVDCPIKEQTPFDPCWYSHKFNGPGLRYEIGVCIQTGEIVWLHGAFPCGSWSDLRIARDAVIYEVEEGEMILADGGYNDGYEFFETPTGERNADQRMKALARARHETINGRIKNWNCLRKQWRHSLSFHSVTFRAVANITQMLIREQGTTFPVEYFDGEE